MKNWSIILFALLLAACGGGNSDEAINAKIVSYQKKVAEYNAKIQDLEKQLSDTSDLATKVPVNIQQVKLQEFNHYIEVNGIVEAVKDAFVSPEMNGQVKQILVTEGQRVKKGDLLIRLNTAVTESSIKELENALELSTKVFEKQKSLWDQKIGSEIQFLEAKNGKESLELKIKTLKEQLKMSEIRAPFGGVVDEIFIKEGELASPGRQVLQLVNLEKLKVNADVSEAYIASVKEGDMVKLSFPSYPGLEMELPVSRIGNVINSENRTFNLELLLDNPGNQLKPNILAIVRINDLHAEKAVVVPSIIIKQDVDGNFLFTAEKDKDTWVAKKKYIKRGMSYIDQTMIVEGLQENDAIIVDGYNMLVNGSPVRINAKLD